MSIEIADRLTPILPQDMLYILSFAWLNLFNEQPKKESLILLIAHTVLETGTYKFTHNHNYGNIKYSEKFPSNFVYYKCNELVSLDYARKLVNSCAKDGGLAEITGVRNDNMAWIWFYPRNKYCKFMAAETKEEGAVFYLNFLKQRYNKFPAVWQSILDANPGAYVHNLKLNGYFTADENIYKASVTRLYNQFLKLDYDPDKLPILSEQQKENVLNLIGLTLNQSIDDMVLDKSNNQE